MCVWCLWGVGTIDYGKPTLGTSGRVHVLVTKNNFY